MKINTTLKRYFLGILLLFTSYHTHAQFAKDGDVTIASLNTIVNQYAILQTDATAGATQIAVTDITQLSNPTPISRGDLVLIIQIQGATIATTNDVDYGNITAYNEAGNYEYAYVTGTLGNNLQLSCGLAQTYRAAGRTQVIRVPQYRNLTVNLGASVISMTWNGTRGGIVAIHAQNIILNGSIDASARGFRGGALDNSSANNQANFFSASANAGGEKGESIAGYQTEYTALGGRFGKGAPANGGGGGNGNNAGGGGGANAGIAANWFRGAGVMCAACTGNTAWTLDPDYIANGNARTNSSGGGKGGYCVGTSNQNALTLAPGTAGWGSDLRRPNGGLGGRPLNINPANRIFLAGGGGAGDQNNSAGGRGGNGGGIVYIVTTQITGAGSINANGENGTSTVNPNTDAPGGAGGGGTVIIRANTSISAITINANGGNGGNHLGVANQSHGPGGGGGGGYIAIFTPTDGSAKNVNGGTNGTTTSTALTEFPTNGATSGNVGIIATSTTVNHILTCNITPTPQNDASTTSEDNATSGNLSSNDSDLETSTSNLTYTAGTFATTQGGSIVIAANGTFSYTPVADFNGTDTYTYTVCDNGLPTNQCATATITFTVLPVNDAPVAVADNFSVNEDAALSGNVSPNDTDGDPELTQTLIFIVQNGGTAATNGVLVLNTDGTFSYTPNSNFNGTVSFSYQVCDNGTPNLCVAATATITVNPINDAPVAGADNFSVNEDAIFNENASLNDTDGDPETTQTLTYTLQSGGTAATNGVLVLNTDGTFSYTPNSNFNGVVSFSYQVCDNGIPNLCVVATVTITVNPINDAPVAGADNFSVNEDAVLNGNVSLNDTDGDPELAQTLTFALQSGGTATTNGILILNADGTFSYTPNSNFNGVVSFLYQVCDNGTPSLCVVATVNITISPINDTPIATDDNFAVDEDILLNGNLSLNDTDGDPELAQTLTFALQSGGTATTNGNLTLNPNGTFDYAPNSNFNGVVSFTYQVCDNGTPSLCVVATATITVNSINDIPIANADNFSTTTGVVLNNTVAANDTDSDNLPTELNYTLVTGGAAAANGTLVLNADGTFSFTPAASFTGTVFFIYEVCDPSNACTQNTATILVTSQPPVALTDSFTTNEDTQLSADVSTNDSDLDTPKNQLTFNLVSGGTAATNGSLSLNTNGTFSYNPNLNFNGAVTFTYRVCDAQNNCSANTNVTITVNPINDAPVAQDDATTTSQSQTVTGNLAENDTDPENDPLTFKAGSFTTNNQGKITIEANGTFTYSPAVGFVGTDCYEYTVCDNTSACSKAQICIIVVPSTTLFIPEGFSPNGDGLYDAFIIEGASDKKISLKIINRWGNVVYQSSDYKNDWKGIGNMGLHTGENLPDGTYFYTLDFGDGSKPLSNYVIIKR